jgi:excisionase family DNA binding protein
MPKLLTVRDTAPILGMAIITLRRLLKKHEIPYHKIGKRYFFTEEDIQKYLSQTAVPMGEVKK